MAIVLKKGNSFNITKKEPTLKKALIGLGWELKQGNALDLDASVFMINSKRKLPQEEYLIFYNNLNSPDGSIKHTGDNRTGVGDDDDEMILANLDAIRDDITEILIIVSIHDAEARRHNFGMLTDAYIRITDVETKREILRYDLDAEYPTNTDIEFGRIKKENNEWIFYASGIGANQGLEGYINIYA